MAPFLVDTPKCVLSAEYTFRDVPPNADAPDADEKRKPETILRVTLVKKGLLGRVKGKFSTRTKAIHGNILKKNGYLYGNIEDPFGNEAPSPEGRAFSVHLPAIKVHLVSVTASLTQDANVSHIRYRKREPQTASASGDLM